MTTTQPSPAEDRVADTDRRTRLATLIDRYVWDRHGPEDAAIRVLADDEIRDALAALPLIRRLRADHQWIEHPDSTWRSCTCGVLGCRIPDQLERAL